jgi:hypothetical protein
MISSPLPKKPNDTKQNKKNINENLFANNHNLPMNVNGPLGGHTNLYSRSPSLMKYLAIRIMIIKA